MSLSLSLLPHPQSLSSVGCQRGSLKVEKWDGGMGDGGWGDGDGDGVGGADHHSIERNSRQAKGSDLTGKLSAFE